MYQHGKGVEQSYERAKEYYEQAAHLGHANAQFNLGCLYTNGQGVEQDLIKARELMAKAAAQGDEKATEILKQIDADIAKQNSTRTPSNNEGERKEEDSTTEQTNVHQLVKSCSGCGAASPKMKCPCKTTRYCNSTCQRKHWKHHKHTHKRIVKQKQDQNQEQKMKEDKESDEQKEKKDENETKNDDHDAHGTHIDRERLAKETLTMIDELSKMSTVEKEDVQIEKDLHLAASGGDMSALWKLAHMYSETSPNLSKEMFAIFQTRLEQDALNIDHSFNAVNEVNELNSPDHFENNISYDGDFEQEDEEEEDEEEVFEEEDVDVSAVKTLYQLISETPISSIVSHYIESQHIVNINHSCTNDGVTCLMLASQKKLTADNNLSIVNLLLKMEGIDVNQQDDRGWTALLCAIKAEHVAVVARLLEVPGVDVNIHNLEGVWPCKCLLFVLYVVCVVLLTIFFFFFSAIIVYMAVELEQPDTVELLLSHALSKSQTEEEMEEMERRDAVMHNMLHNLFRGKFTCLMKAKEEGFEVIVELLRKYGAKTSFCYASDLSI